MQSTTVDELVHEEKHKSENLHGDVGSHKSHPLEGQVRVDEGVVVASLTHFDHVHKMMAGLCWRALGNHNLHELKEALVVVKSNYLHLLVDRDHFITLGEIYFDALKRKDDEVYELCRELSLAHSSSSTVETRSSRAAIKHEYGNGTQHLREETLGMVEHEDHSDLHGLDKRYGLETFYYTHTLHL